jgi:hypothetical protein
LDDELRERLHVIEAEAIKLCLGETELCDSICLGEERRGPFDTIRHQRAQRRRLGRVDEEAATRVSVQKRRIRFLRDLGEAARQQAPNTRSTSAVGRRRSSFDRERPSCWRR